VTAKGALVTVGNFDGVHRGHTALLLRALAEARAMDLEVVLLTFEPHPAVVLGRAAPARLTPLPRKRDLIARLSTELRVVVEPFNLELAALTPEEFARDLLVQRLGAKRVIVGANFRFGVRRSGGLAELAELGRVLGFEARAAELEVAGGQHISSSRVREAVAGGSVELAENLLGRPHALTGSVIAGDRIARQLGVPTANLGGIEELMPGSGVYAVLVDVERGEQFERLGTGVANVGTRPTTGSGEMRAEVHVHDWQGDLYGQRLRVHWVQRLRGETRFAGIEPLRAQLARDVEDSKRCLQGRTPDPLALGAWH
jgi:riboflavin kinase / FMN adenylyltransferase